MKNLLEALEYTGMLTELRHLYNESTYYLAGIDFISQKDDVYTVSCIDGNHEIITKNVVRELFPWPIINAVAMHLDSKGPGHVTKTILIVKLKNPEFKVYTGRRRGRFNSFVKEIREENALRKKFYALKATK